MSGGPKKYDKERSRTWTYESTRCAYKVVIKSLSNKRFYRRFFSCEHMWIITGCIHIKRKNRLAKPTVEETVCSHDNLVLKKTMMENPKKMISRQKIKINFVSDTGRLTAVVSWQLSPSCRTTDSCGN